MDSAKTRETLCTLYEAERARLAALAKADTPAGEYAAPVFGSGDVRARILLIGEAPGAEETRRGTPFVGKAGGTLDALFAHFGVARTQAYITNVVKYRPVVRGTHGARNRTPNRAEVEAALPLLRAEIDALRPMFVLTLGNTPLGAVCALAGAEPVVIGRVHGEKMPLCIGKTNVVLIPLYHPASAIYNPALKETLIHDAANVRALLGEAGVPVQTACAVL